MNVYEKLNALVEDIRTICEIESADSCKQQVKTLIESGDVNEVLLIIKDMGADIRTLQERSQAAELEARRLHKIEEQLETMRNSKSAVDEIQTAKERELQLLEARLEEREALYSEMRWMFQTVFQTTELRRKPDERAERSIADTD